MKLLIVDDDPIFWARLRNRLGARTGLTCAAKLDDSMEIETDYDRVLEMLRLERAFDAAIINPLPLLQGPQKALEIIEAVKKSGAVALAVPRLADVRNCVDCMRAGAIDYIPRLGSSDEIVDSVHAAISRAVAEQNNGHDADAAYVQKNFPQLLADYSGKWIAVAGGTLLDVADTHEALTAAVAKAPPIGPIKFWLMPKRWPQEKK